MLEWVETTSHGLTALDTLMERPGLLELCSYHKLSISNTFFNTKPHHRVSWMHPRSHHWHQLDLIIIRRAQLQSVLTTRSYHNTDCDTDHSLVHTKVRLRPKKFHHSMCSDLPCINIATTVIPELCAQFAESAETALEGQPAAETTEERWCLLRDTIHSTAQSIFGKKERQNPDWYNESLPVMEPAINAKRDALMNYKREPSNNNLAALRSARNEAQRTARHCHSIQEAADRGNTRGVYEGMKKALGPSAQETAPLKSSTGETITDRSKQMDRWQEHYQDLRYT